MKYLYEEDREIFVSAFNKENIVNELNRQGRFAITYRLLSKTNEPFYVNMKVMRMQHQNHLIFAVSNIDAQKKQQELLEKAQQEQIIYSRLMSLSGDFICMYVVNPETEEFTEYNASKEYSDLQLPKHGTNFFEITRKNSALVLHPDDVAGMQKAFTKENIMESIAEKGLFMYHARLMLAGEPKPYTVKASLVKENGEDRLVVGIRL